MIKESRLVTVLIRSRHIFVLETPPVYFDVAFPTSFHLGGPSRQDDTYRIPPTVRPMAAHDVPELLDPTGSYVVAALAVDGLDPLPPHAMQSERVLGLLYCLYLRSH